MQNHQNPREYGISRHDQFPTSSRRDERWTGGNEWSARDETWRGSSRPPERREDSWKGGSDFRLGRDRAPFPVDDQFLVRFGAKRLNNGSLVDRDGFTLRQRDPGCRAPSPPNFNPGREFRREERLPDSFRARDYSEQLRFDGPPPFRGPEPRPPPRNGPVHLPERPRHEPRRFERSRHEFRRPDPPRRHSPPRKSKPPVQEPKEPAKVDEDLEKKARQQIEMMNKMEAEEKKKPKIAEKNEEEPEGEDEYEEVPPEPTPPSASVLAAQHLNNIKKPLLPLPTQPKTNIKKALIPQTPPIPPKNPREESWFNQYKKHVEELREKVYGTYEPPSVSSTSSYFFQSTPSASTSFATSSTSPFYSNPGWEAPPTTVAPKPPQMDLPPPGIVKMEPMEHTSSYSDAFGIRNSQKQIPPPPDSSDSEDEDIAKLKEIIKNCGRSSSSNY